jgi:hypothetical protein
MLNKKEIELMQTLIQDRARANNLNSIKLFQNTPSVPFSQEVEDELNRIKYEMSIMKYLSRKLEAMELAE